MTAPRTLPGHELKCGISSWKNIQAGARATCRRIDDRDFRAGDRLCLVLVTLDGRLVEPRQEIEATVTRVERVAGPHLLFGAIGLFDGCEETQLVPIPFALIHFALEDDAPRVVGDVEDYRKILSFAASAGDTIAVDEALDVIKSICRNHLFSVRGQS